MGLKALFSILLLTMSNFSWAYIDLSKADFSHLYDPNSEIKLDYHLTSNAEGITLFMRTQFRKYSAGDYAFKYYLQNGYTDADEISSSFLNMTEDLVGGDSLDQTFRVSLPAPDNYQMIVLEVYSRRSEIYYFYDISLDEAYSFPPSGVLAMKDSLPYFESYLSPRDTVEYVDNDLEPETVFGFRYPIEFKAALPPMTLREEQVPSSLEIDSTFRLEGAFTPPSQGLFFMQTDSSTLSGKGYIVVKPLFPRLITLTDLVEPIIYISTVSEYSRLSNANSKRAFDRFWLDVTGDADRARGVIKRYYRQVETANTLFSTYKEGWKTDMGMVFIMFGSPDEVIKTGDQEIWNYERDANIPKVRFTFNRVKNIFTDRHFQLDRQESFERIWFRRVDQWRKGRI